MKSADQIDRYYKLLVKVSEDPKHLEPVLSRAEEQVQHQRDKWLAR